MGTPRTEGGVMVAMGSIPGISRLEAERNERDEMGLSR